MFLKIRWCAKRALYSIFPLIISFNSRKFLKVLSDVPPKGVVLSLIFVKCFKVIALLSNIKICKSYMPDSKLLISDELIEQI